MSDQAQPTHSAAEAAPTNPTSLPDAQLFVSRPTTRVIAVIAEKGGVGTLRATTAVNLAAAFARSEPTMSVC